MTATQKITSITQFMDWVRKCTQSISVNTPETPAFFYRGITNENYQFQPSVYRTDKDGKSYRAVEYQLYQDMLHRNPTAFSEDKTLFERLVRMQHYGLPTRLVDITQNPLVALFFACRRRNDKNGQVMFFGMPQSKVVYPAAIPQVALAGVETSLTLSRLGLVIADRFRLYFGQMRNFPLGNDEELNNAYHMFLSNCIKDVTTISLHPHDLLSTNAILKNIGQAVNDFTTQGGDYLKNKVEHVQSSEQKIMLMNVNLYVLDFNKRFWDFVISTITDLCKQINITYDENVNSFV